MIQQQKNIQSPRLLYKGYFKKEIGIKLRISLSTINMPF